jgi:dipicolinate synthase subunit B
MEVKDISVGFCLTGSFCTFDKVFLAIEKLVELGAIIMPIISNSVNSNDTRFIKAAETKRFLKLTTGRDAVNKIIDVEPIGPKVLLDIIVVAPCTGNTMAKIANGISDTPVTLAVKSHLRNDRPVLLAISTNDALSGNAKNLGLLLNVKNIFFVPMGQDNFKSKKTSVVADMSLIIDAVKLALEKKQIQPMLIDPK